MSSCESKISQRPSRTRRPDLCKATKCKMYWSPSRSCKAHVGALLQGAILRNAHHSTNCYSYLSNKRAPEYLTKMTPKQHSVFLNMCLLLESKRAHKRIEDKRWFYLDYFSYIWVRVIITKVHIMIQHYTSRYPSFEETTLWVCSIEWQMP